MNAEVKPPALPSKEVDATQVAQAMRGFVSEFGPTAALALESCVHCGRCAEACQYYVQTGEAKYTPIHKIAPFRRAYERQASPFAFAYRLFGLAPKVTGAELESWQSLIYDSCNMCGRCSLICPMGIDIADLVEQARHGMYDAGLAPADYLGALAEKEHASGSPFGLGAAEFRTMLHAIGEQHGTVMHVDEPHADIVPTVSSIDLKTYPGSMAAIAKILNHMGVSWTFRTDGFDADNVSLVAGDRAGQRATTMGIVNAAIACGAKTLLMPECGHSFTELRWEAANELGRRLPFRVMHITEYLAEALADGTLRVNPVQQKATYHDACQLSRRGGATAAPRTILQALGVDLHEMADAGDANWCCGGGGGVALIKRAAPLREKAFEIKQHQIEATGMDTVYTSCSGCRQTLDHGGKAAGWTTSVGSLLELVADHLEAADDRPLHAS